MDISEEIKVAEASEAFKARRNVWIRLDCYFCQRRMVMTSMRATQNAKTGQHYIKTVYVCPHCDYWHTVKVPRKLAATIVDETCLPAMEAIAQSA